MKAIKSKLLKLYGGLVFLLVGLVLSLIFFGHGSIYAFAAESEQVAFSEKVYSHATISENFDDSSIIVILDRNVSGINKRHNTDFFNGIEILGIEDLSVVADSARSIIDTKNFEQTLCITLPQDSKENVLQTIKKLEGIDGIKYVGPNRYREIEREPNDPLYTDALGGENSQWGLQKIQSDLAWNISTGNNTVRVGIIDTGIGVIVDGQANHPDLNANLVNAGGDFVNMTSTINNIPGTLRADTSGHGTHVAGIVGAAGNNGVGVSGVNWNVSLVPMQVAKGAVITDAACVRAVRFATNTWNTANRISILNMSIGSSGVWPDMENAIRAYPGLFICSTGNNRHDNDVIRHYPSFYGSDMHTNRLTNMISVGRSDINDERPTGTNDKANWGARTIDLFAPGHNIVSTYPTTGITSNWGVGYHRTSGSSMAAPMVAGVAALLLSVNADLTTAQLRAAIINNVDVMTAFENDPTTGRQCVTGGRLNAFKALSSVVFATSNVSGGISIDGFVNGYTLPNSTNLILPNRFAPQGSIEQQNVVAIGASAFANQASLNILSVPNNVTNIDANAFANCYNLTINLLGRSQIPSSWNSSWNSSNRPVMFNGVLCSHENGGAYTKVPDFHIFTCIDCKVKKTSDHELINEGDFKVCECDFKLCLGSHDHNKYSPIIGMRTHIQGCKNCDYASLPQRCFTPAGLPGDTVYCKFCKQAVYLGGGGIIFTITLPNGEKYMSESQIDFASYVYLMANINMPASYYGYLQAINSTSLIDIIAQSCIAVLSPTKEE